MAISFQTLDVRPILLAGGEPFSEVMQVVAKLDPGQGLRLLATFQPVPLFSVMKKKGFSHDDKALEGGDWEIEFRPDSGRAGDTAKTECDAHDAPVNGAHDADAWPAPSRVLDNRGMMPPEPLVITLEAIEHMTEGQVLESWYDRDPLLLYPELQTRGHRAQCEKRGPSEYRVLIRRGAQQASAS